MTSSDVMDRFAYGPAGASVELEAEVPVWTCDDCGIELTDDAAERARHDAVCDYLRVLRPTAIRALRAALGLTQQKLADLTGVGIASVKRWEAGTVIQNASMNSLLLVLDISEVRQRLASQHSRTQPTFRTRLSDEQIAMAGEFQLRRALSEAA